MSLDISVNTKWRWNITPCAPSPTEHGHREGERVGAAGSYRGQSQREGAGGAEGPFRTDQRDRPRKGAAQEGGGHPAFQSSHVWYGEILAYKVVSTDEVSMRLIHYDILLIILSLSHFQFVRQVISPLEGRYFLSVKVVLFFEILGTLLRCNMVRYTS